MYDEQFVDYIDLVANTNVLEPFNQSIVWLGSNLHPGIANMVIDYIYTTYTLPVSSRLHYGRS